MNTKLEQESSDIDYANRGDESDLYAEFNAAVTDFVNSKLGSAPSQKVIDVITRLLNADSKLNRPHSINLQQRTRLLFELLKAYIQKNKIDNCWPIIKELASLKPYAKDIKNLIENIARPLRIYKKTRIVLLISCRPRITIALSTKEKLKKILGDEFKIIIVIGQRETDMHPSYFNEDILIVNSNDNYESLPNKIANALEFIYTKFEDGTSCFKVDEDLDVNDGELLLKLMHSLCISDFQYAGFAGNNKENFERTWHYGKCENNTISRRPYGKRYPGAFAYGPFYYLSYNAIRTFVSENIRFPDEILGHLYEDKFIGDTLREGGITISALNPFEWIPAVGKHWWTINRLWDQNENTLLN